MRNTQRIHFVGIGGIGMSGIAEVLLNLGYTVSGSDLALSDVTRRLQQQGATVSQGHAAAHVQGADVVVISSAVKSDNVEVLTARAQHIPVIPRAEMLAELMRLKYGVAIAGTHGKTTTTSLVATVLADGGLDPTVVIGGRLNSLGSNAKLGQGAYLVAEADESDGSFLLLSPTISVVTTVDAEHLDFYGDLEAVKRAFTQFINKVPFYGCSVICLDQSHIQSLVPQIHRRFITYGLTSQADYVARDLRFTGARSRFDVFCAGTRLGQFSLNLPGTHNVSNALAAIAVGVELDVPLPTIAKALAEFSGVHRRFEVRGVRDSVTVVDDYGHHPEEIRQTLRAAKSVWPEARLVVVFQPHRYTRTHLLQQEFCTAFYDADALVLLDIYAAGETPLPGVTTALLYEGLIGHGQREVYYLQERAAVVPFLRRYVRAHDVLLTLGAGDVWQIGETFVHATGQRDMAQSRSPLWNLPTLLRDVPGRKDFARPLAPFTSIRIGGPADALVRLETLDALRHLRAIAREHAIPLFILGGGSNLLIRDGGIRGIVVLLRGAFRSYSVEACSPATAPMVAHVHVGVGYPLSRLALQLARQGWSGLEFAYGIPGTLGGAMVMNAGTHLGDMSRVLVTARMLLSHGQVQELPASALGLRYRGSSYPPDTVLLGATLRLQQGQREQIEALMHASYARRQRTQPLSQPNTGSIFKNPPGTAAGRLIEALGLKGTRIGGAMISPVHANFIVNVDHATAANVAALIAHVQERVRAVYDVVLEPEVHIVGEEG